MGTEVLGNLNILTERPRGAEAGAVIPQLRREAGAPQEMGFIGPSQAALSF